MPNVDSTPITVGHALTQTTRSLSATSPTARLDAEVLLAHVLKTTRASLLAQLHDSLSDEHLAAFEALVARRSLREPVAYLVGQRAFYGLDLVVDSRVLIPRPETELLVDLALRAAPVLELRRGRPLRIADIGTGSGAVALALAQHVRTARIYATDVSAEALQVAEANCARYRLQERVMLLQGELLTPLPEPVDMLVSNPPYTVLTEIDEGVRRYEPRLALDGGPDGLYVYQQLVQQAPASLSEGGCMLLEIGATQATQVCELVRAVFPAATLRVEQDLAGYDRVIVVRL
jgi:release factor glutamine methyltransferase